MQTKTFKLVIFDEEQEEFVERVSFFENEKGFKNFKTPEELFNARKQKFSHLDNTHIITEKSTVEIEQFREF